MTKLIGAFRDYANALKKGLERTAIRPFVRNIFRYAVHLREDEERFIIAQYVV
jgi:hypothetical protein